jgi:hypothetical protein
MHNLFPKRETVTTILIFLVLLVMAWVPDGNSQDVRYCKKESTGEIVVVDIHSRCPDGYWEVR